MQCAATEQSHRGPAPARLRLLTALVAALIVAVPLAAVPAQADPDGLEPRSGVATQIGTLSAQLTRADQDLRNASVTASVAVETYERAVVVEGRDAAAYRGAQRADATAAGRVDRQRDAVGAMVRDNYELGGTVQATALVVNSSPANLIANVGYLRYAAQRQGDTLGAYRQAHGTAVLAAGSARSALAASTRAERAAAAAKKKAQAAVASRSKQVAAITARRKGLQTKLDAIDTHNAAVRAAQRAADARRASQATDVDYQGGAGVAVRAALDQVGEPYVWDAASPSVGFDCSGLVLYAYQQIGISLPHSAEYQYLAGRHVSRDQLQPGDLLFYSYNGQVSGIHHVTMYLGNGMIVQAPDFGIPVQVVPAYFDFGYIGATRLV